MVRDGTLKDSHSFLYVSGRGIGDFVVHDWPELDVYCGDRSSSEVAG